MFGRSFVAFCGSRCLPAGAGAFVSQVVASVVSSGAGVVTGCAVGADAAVIKERLALPFLPSTSGPELVIFSAFGSRGEGAWQFSAVSAVQRAAQLAVSPGHGCCAPVQVHWSAGSHRSPRLASRLRARSAAMVRWVAQHGGRRRGLVAFVLGGWDRSPGSWVTIRQAVQSGVPVVVFPCSPVSGSGECRWGFSAGFRRLPSLSRWCGPGQWVQAGQGVWSLGFRWVPR